MGECREWDDELDDWNFAICDYYQGVGICTFGCSEEPECMTGEPFGGWPDPEFHPMRKANMRGRRLHRRIDNWLAWNRPSHLSDSKLEHGPHGEVRPTERTLERIEQRYGVTL